MFFQLSHASNANDLESAGIYQNTRAPNRMLSWTSRKWTIFKIPLCLGSCATYKSPLWYNSSLWERCINISDNFNSPPRNPKRPTRELALGTRPTWLIQPRFTAQWTRKLWDSMRSPVAITGDAPISCLKLQQNPINTIPTGHLSFIYIIYINSSFILLQSTVNSFYLLFLKTEFLS